MRVVVDVGETGAEGGNHAARFDPNILVLTHSDRDHIGGFADFIAARPARLSEVWVPYEWGLLTQAYAGLMGGLQTGTERQTSPDKLRGLGQSKPVEPPLLPPVELLRRDRQGGGPDLADSAETQLHVLGLEPSFNAERLEAARVESAIAQAIEKERGNNPQWPPVPSPEEAKDVAADLTAKSVQLLTIVQTSLRLGVRVRFFSTDAVGADSTAWPPWASAGIPGMVTMVNAVEVFFVRSTQVDPGMNLYLVMRLTAQNRRALAPFLWDSGRSQVLDQILSLKTKYWDDLGDLQAAEKPWGVLVWSDGAGESAKVTGKKGIHADLVPWEHVALMTAPHHASATDDFRMIWQAREAFCEYIEREIPVLSAGGMMTATAKGFTDLPIHLRACTRCRHLKDRPSKTVVAVINGPGTSLTPGCLE